MLVEQGDFFGIVWYAILILVRKIEEIVVWHEILISELQLHICSLCNKTIFRQNTIKTVRLLIVFGKLRF
ncbi:hypothetical protein LINGRAHAP2_LOCUS5172 [Linum grandiflorum]